jgi:hypothetical protein
LELGPDAGIAASLVGAAAVVASLVGAVVLGGGVDGSAVAGSVESAPTSSSTTGTFAYGSFGVAVVLAEVATCECVSLTTGTVRRTDFVVDFGATAAFAADDADADCLGRAGSGASLCSVGTRRIGAANDGSASDVSGAAAAVDCADACRSATAIGATYIATSTITPMPVHQYFSPRCLTATSPYGFAAATDA